MMHDARGPGRDHNHQQSHTDRATRAVRITGNAGPMSANKSCPAVPDRHNEPETHMR